MINSARSTSSSASSASSSSPPVNPASLASSLASLASSSSPPVIPMVSASSASSSIPPVIPVDSATLASSSILPVIPASTASFLSINIAAFLATLASSSSPPVIPMVSASSASSSIPPVIPVDSATLASSSILPVIPASTASFLSINIAAFLATLASSSSPPVIPMVSASSASSSIPPVIPVDSATLASSSSPDVIPMDTQLRQLLKACNKGDLTLCNHFIIAYPDILHSTTPHKNNLLHIAAMLGHDEFARSVWSKAPSLFSGTNIDGETPLITALMAGNLPLATKIFTVASHDMQNDDLEEGFNRMLLMVDRCKENVLHHAMRNGFDEFALELLMKEPRLSEQVTNIGESPMYMAARRGYSDVVARLLEIPSSAVYGPDNESALHAAVEFNHPGIVKQLLEKRSQLAYHEETTGKNPLDRAIFQNNLELVKIFLECDPNLAYIKKEKSGTTPFIMAVQKGFVSIAKEIMSVCPDSVYTPDKYGDNALMHAIYFEKPDSFDYILKTSQVHRQINQANNNGKRPLHCAAMKCDPKLVRSLLAHKGQDYTAVDKSASTAVNTVYHQHELWKTLKWNETFSLLSNEIPSTWKHEIRDTAKKTIKEEAIKEVKSLTKKYTSNTSLVAALLATITFAAAFSLPGGFSPDPTHAGLPVFVRKITFQLFLIFDTIAMCSSLAVAFLCILATWEDLDFLLNYKKTTRALMWCAYEATAVAFATGLFTVIAPNNLWLAIPILVFCTILPFISMIIGEWPLLMVRYRLGRLFRKDLIPNI